MRLKILVALTALASFALAAESGMELYQKAVTQERAGKMEDAIKLYEKVAHDFAADRPLAAKALFQAATGYEKLGQDKASKLYEQLTREYGDQREAATARAKLVAIRQRDQPVAPPTMTLRQITPLGSPITESAAGSYGTFHSDGQHALYLDKNAGGLVLSDLSGNNKRVIFKNAPNRSIFAFMPSRDYSMIQFGLVDAAGERTNAVIKSDGTGYREVPTTQCTPDFSWDNRYLLFCPSQANGKSPLVRISVADGKVQEVLRGRDIVLSKFSPDGSLVAYSSRAGQLFVVSSQGGEPHLVFDHAQQLLDWTRDGRYLAIVNDSSGSTALSLLPIKEAKAAGESVFVRYGSFYGGWTAASGALAYIQLPSKGYFDAWMAELDARGHPGEWKRLNLSGSSGNSIVPAWSADEASFTYSTPNLAAGQNTWNVRMRDVASGQERGLYESSTGRVLCRSAAQHPILFCQRYRAGMTELFTMTLDSGQVEQIGSLSGTRPLLTPSQDDRALYMLTSNNLRDGLGLIRWEIATGRETIVEPDLGVLSYGVVSLNERWVARWNKGVIETRPVQGGSWKRLISRRSEIGGQFTFSPDGEWFLYHDKDSAGKDGFYRVSTAGGEPERLGDFPSVNMYGYLWVSRSGRKIVAETLNTGPEFWILENFIPKAAK